MAIGTLTGDSRKFNTVSGDQRVTEDLGAALQKVTAVARSELAARGTEQQKGTESLPNTLYGVNLRRGAAFDGLGDIDHSMFEPRRTPLPGVGLTPRAVDAEIRRLRTQYRNTLGERRGGFFDWDRDRNWTTTFGDGSRLYPMGVEIPTVRRNLFADPPARGNDTVAAEERVAEHLERADGELETIRAELAEYVAGEVERKLAERTRQRQTTVPENDDDSPYISLELALKNIKTFDGNNPSRLEEFLSSCEAVWERVKPQQRGTLLALVRSGKLEDRATRELRHKVIRNISELRSEFEALYGKRKSLAALQYEFCLLKQGAKESVAAYSARVERLTGEVAEKLCGDTEPHGARYVEAAVRRSAQMNFENGLNPDIRMIVRSRNYGSLRDSIVGADEVEKMLGTGGIKGGAGVSQPRNTTGGGSATPRKCYNCGITGHVARDCTRKSGRQSLPAPGPGRDVNQVKVTCNFCGKVGHLWRECRKRLQQEGQKMQQTVKENGNSSPPKAQGGQKTLKDFLGNEQQKTEGKGQQREVYVVNVTSGGVAKNKFDERVVKDGT